MKKSNCHPNRKHCAKGMCKQCYKKKWRQENLEHAKNYNRNWNRINNVRLSETTSKWRNDNYDWILKYSRRYHKIHYNSRLNSIRCKQWRKTNLEKKRKMDLAWKKANPEKVKAEHKNRRARKRNAIGRISAYQWKLIKKAYGYQCVYCGKRAKKLTQDHIIALSNGGTHTADNVIPACVSCNSKKGNSTSAYWERLARKGTKV